MAQPAGFAPVIGGWVFKKKGTGGWKRRWAIMYGTVLTWFEQPNTPESPQVEDGIFDVTGAKCLPVKSDKGKWKFSIEGDKKQLILYVEEEMARNQWINGIRSIVEGKFLKGQLMEKPALMTKDGTVLDDDEVKKLAKKGKIPEGVTTSAPVVQSPVARAATPAGQPNQPTFQRNPYQIDELNSPSTSTTSVLGKQLAWSVEEKRRDTIACNLAKERNTFGGGEIGSDENDWLEEQQEKGILDQGCQQQ